MSVRQFVIIACAAAGIGSVAAAGGSTVAGGDGSAGQPVQSAPAPTMPQMQMDCEKQMPLHDHGAERGMPMPQGPGCPQASSTSAKGKAKAIKGHDHARFHKLM